jgi:hypothetical protein
VREKSRKNGMNTTNSLVLFIEIQLCKIGHGGTHLSSQQESSKSKASMGYIGDSLEKKMKEGRTEEGREDGREGLKKREVHACFFPLIFI